MPIRRRSHALAGTVAALLVACGGRTTSRPDAGRQAEARRYGLTEAQSREVLARVGETEITLGEFADRLAAQSPYLRARLNSPERRREMLDNMIRFELLVQEARRRGLDRDDALERLETQALVDELLATEIDSRVRLESITDAEVRGYYDAHPEEWNQPEQVRASHIRFSDRASAQRALTAILAAPTDTELFRRIAREQSTDTASRSVGGDLRFFSRPSDAGRADGEPPPQVALAAFALENVGDVAPRVIQSADGFHVVKLTARRQPFHRTYDEVKRMIQDRLYRERREAMVSDLVARLRREASVREDESALSNVRIEPPQTGGTAP